MKKNNKITVDIICPLYNAEDYILSLNESFFMQQGVEIKSVKYILTESKDNTEKILKENNINYKKIKSNEFSHSLTREADAYECTADIIVFVNQDVKIERTDWLYNLVKDLNEDTVASYSRQLTKYSGIEKYTRLKNYPEVSSTVSKKDIKKLGLKTFFFSDASSAIKRDIFVKLNGYDQKNLPTNEDMYIAYKIIMKGYKIKYCADSEVIHSHKFTLKQLYDRYKLTGKFLKENSYLNQYGTTSTGADLAKYVLKGLIKDMNVFALIRFPFDMAARLFGMKVGKR